MTYSNSATLFGRVIPIAKALQKSSIEPVIFALDESFQKYPREISMEETRVIFIGQAHFTYGQNGEKRRFGPFRYGLETCRTFRRLLRQLRRIQPTAVHVFTADPGALLTAAGLQILGYRIVLDLDDSVYGMAVMAHYPKPVCWLQLLLEEIIPKTLPRVTVGTSPLAKHYPRAVHIPYSVSISRFIRSSPPFSFPNITVIMVGTMGAQHLHMETLEAIKKIVPQNPRIRFRFVGGGERFCSIQSRIRTLGLETAVELTGPLNHEDSIRQMCQADIGLCPVNDNPFDKNRLPIKLLEYMAAELAIVTTPVGGIEEIIRHLENGWLYRPGDMEDLCRGILSLVAQQESARRMAAQSRKDVIAFDTDLIAHRWLAYYEKNAR